MPRDLLATGPKDLLAGHNVSRETSQPQQPAYSGSLWPVSYDEENNISFDSDAGLLGMVKRGATAPGDVWTGKLDPESPEGLRRAAEMAIVFGPAGAASRVKGSVFAPARDYKKVVPKAPTREALKKATSEGYERAGNLGVEYKSTAVKAMADKLQRSLDEQGFFAELAPEVHALIGKLQKPPAKSSVSLKSIDAFRKRLGDIAGSTDKTKASAASQAINAVDDFLGSANSASIVDRAASPGPGLVSKGYNFKPADAAATRNTAKEAAATIKAARGNAAAGFRADKITDLEEVMGLRAAAAHSGMNIDNTARSKLVSLLTNSGGKGVRGFNDAEKAAITKIIMGTPAKNLGRRFGNMMGGGGGLGQTLMTAGPAATAGLATGSPLAAAAAATPGIAGALAKLATNSATKKELKMLGELIRSRSPLHDPTPQIFYAPRATPGIFGRAGVLSSTTGVLSPRVQGRPMGNMTDAQIRQFIARGGA